MQKGGVAGSGDGPAVQAGLQADVRAAAAHLGDALRGLLYVVLLSSQEPARCMARPGEEV